MGAASATGAGAGATGAGAGATAAATIGAAATGATGAAGAAAGSGDVSTFTLTDSERSVEALRNSRMLLPSDAPTSGSLPGPRIRRAITRMMMSSGAPIFGITVLLSMTVRAFVSILAGIEARGAALRRLG